jgi:DNA repair protein RadC
MCLMQPSALRPRERLYSTGSGEISDAELIAVVLGTGTAGKDAVTLAREILDAAGGLPALGRALPHELSRHSGIGQARAARLAAAFALGRRALLHDRPPGALLATPADVHRYVWPRLAGIEQEVFLVIAVDARQSVITDLEIARGSASGVDVHPREVFRPLIRLGATSAIAVHNHPSGDPTPSTEDIVLTERLRTVGSLVGIPLVDHIIVAARGAISLDDWVNGRPG